MSLLKLTSKNNTFSQQQLHSLNDDIQIGITFLLSNTCRQPAVLLPIFVATDGHSSNPYGVVYLLNTLFNKSTSTFAVI